MRKNRNWHGIDQSREVSLFEQGLLIRWVPKQKEWQVIYKNPYVLNIYSFSWTDEQKLISIFQNDWAKDKKDEFLTFHGITWTEYTESTILQKMSDVCGYFGAENLFGDDHSGGDTIKQICKRLKIKFNSMYEQ